MQVDLFKRDGKYHDEETNTDKPFTNLYIRAGNTLVPIEVKYFGTNEKPDKQYAPRRAVLSAFADELPPLADDGKASDKKS